MLFRDLVNGGKFAAPCVGEERIDAAGRQPLNLGVELIEVCEIAGVSLDTCRAGPISLYSGLKHFFATTGDDDFCAFRYESLCRREADAGASSGDKGETFLQVSSA